jgi:hypothetical protein
MTVLLMRRRIVRAAWLLRCAPKHRLLHLLPYELGTAVLSPLLLRSTLLLR